MSQRDEKYSRDELEKDLYLMVKAGLLEVFMRDDGQWVYAVTEEAKKLTEEQTRELLDNLSDFDDTE